jgi:hypothetical protein
VSRNNVTYFESPHFPLSSRSNIGSCFLTVFLARGVRQVLLEFLFFELLPPTEGNCLDDRFFVTGQATNSEIPIICGVATGQHSEIFIEVVNWIVAHDFCLFFLSVFIEVEGSDKVQLVVQTRTADDRAFSIKVTQLIHSLSPAGCLQYYQQSNGVIKSFNYDDYSRIQLKRYPSYFV